MLLGSDDGWANGRSLGVTPGIEVGPPLGLIDTCHDGLSVTAHVGTTDGQHDGPALVAPLEASDGCIDGSRSGGVDGAAFGLMLTITLGTALGAVGNTDGITLGTALGAPTGSLDGEKAS